ncbi:ATP-binding cassette domain-containing protein [Nitratidesulfovibrio sp.]|uniref:ABC transporter ATP-binding protein n=1 Tax=Nitratidesulfovibrio sp. TaxID=2802297 RepID=UPI00334273D0
MQPLLQFDDVSFAYASGTTGNGAAKPSAQPMASAVPSVGTSAVPSVVTSAVAPSAPALQAGPPGLAHVNLAVHPGDFVMLTGPSGAGKSTLLRLAVRLEEADAGVVRCGGRPVADIPPAELRRALGFVQQTPTVGAGTVRDNLLLPFTFAANKGLTPPDDAELAGWLARFRLAGVGLDAVAASLSVGQRQRVCIIRTMLLRPAALLMDEPTSALDQESSAVVEALTEELNEDGVTVLMVTHGAYRPVRRPWRNVRVQDGGVQEAAVAASDVAGAAAVAAAMAAGDAA